MSQPSYTGKMPNEILARILQFLRNSIWDLQALQISDLKACRLVDKQISAVATRQFAKAKFCSLNIVYTTRSLQTLANICAHPDLGAYVRRIWFSPFRTSPETISRLTDIFKDKLKDGGQGSLDIAYRNLQSCIQTSYEERNLDQSGQGVRLFTAALRSLKNRGISIDISLDNDSQNDGIGSKGTFRNVWTYDPDELIVRDCTNEHASIIFRALSHSECQVNSFEIWQADLGGSVGDLIDLAYSAGPALGSFAMLRSLNLDFMRLPKQKTLDSLDFILGQLRNLETLSLELGWIRPHNPNRYLGAAAFSACDTILRTLNTTSLQQVSLRDVCISEKRLVAMLRGSRGSLKNLSLWCVCLAYGCWNHFLSWLHNKFRLDRLTLTRLFETKGDRYSKWNKEKLKDGHELRFCGNENIRSGLSRLLPEGYMVADQLGSEV